MVLYIFLITGILVASALCLLGQKRDVRIATNVISRKLETPEPSEPAVVMILWAEGLTPPPVREQPSAFHPNPDPLDSALD